MNYDNYMTADEFAEVNALLDILGGYSFDEIGFDVLLSDKNGDSLGQITTREGNLAWTPEDPRDQ